MTGQTDSHVRIVRDCGASECMSTAWHELGIYFRISSTALLIMPREKLERRTASSLIRTAVGQVVLAQPVMRVGIIGQNSKRPQFVGLPSIDLSRQVEDDEAASDDALARGLENILLQPWPDLSTRPGWHVRIFHEPDAAAKDVCKYRICLTVHHAICDGLSTAKFHTCLVDALNNPDPAINLMIAKSQIIQLIDNLADYPPPQDKLVSFTADLSWVASQIWNNFAPKILKPFALEPWAGKPHNPNIKAVHIRHLTLESKVAEMIVRRCREEKCTVTSLLNALCATSLARRVPKTEQQSFVSSTSISLRPWISQEAGFNSNHLSVCVTGYEQELDPATLASVQKGVDTNVWELAAQLRQDMKRKTDMMPHNDFSFLAPYAGDWRNVFQARYGKPRRELWGLSNLGSIAATAPMHKGDWELKSVLFVQFFPVVTCAIAVNVATVKGGDMTVSIVWQDEIIETEHVQGLRDDLEIWLRRLGREGSFGI